MTALENRNDIRYCEKCSNHETFIRQTNEKIEIRCQYCKHVIIEFQNSLLGWNKTEHH